MPHDASDSEGRMGYRASGERQDKHAGDRGASSIFGLSLGFFRSLFGKLIFSFVFILVLTCLATLAALYSISRMENKIRIVEEFDSLNQKIFEIRRHEKNFLLYGNAADLVNALEILDGVSDDIDQLKEQNPQYAHWLLSRVNIEGYETVVQRLTHQEGKEANGRLKEELRHRGHALMEAVQATDNKVRQEVDRQAKHYKDIVLILFWVVLPLGTLLSVALANWILAPLQYIRQAVARVMQGELSAIPVEATRGKCVECTALIESLNKMLYALETKQHQLVQSEKLAAIGKVTAGIAHEINNPLNNIYLTAEVLLEDIGQLSEDEGKDMVQDILIQSDRARDVVRHLLDFSRSRKPSAWVSTDLVDLTQKTLVLLKNEIKIEQIDTRTEYASEPVMVMGNPNQLQQVLVNIILNGVQAMKPSGTLFVRVSAHPEEEEAIVEIEDTGPGIPEDVREHIFEPFFTTKSEGTGLGLSVSYGIIKEHRGQITVHSRSGGGTVFRIALPLWR